MIRRDEIGWVDELGPRKVGQVDPEIEVGGRDRTDVLDSRVDVVVMRGGYVLGRAGRRVDSRQGRRAVYGRAEIANPDIWAVPEAADRRDKAAVPEIVADDEIGSRPQGQDAIDSGQRIDPTEAIPAAIDRPRIAGLVRGYAVGVTPNADGIRIGGVDVNGGAAKDVAYLDPREARTDR